MNLGKTTNVLANQENVSNVKKVISNKVQNHTIAFKRGALGDLGNKLNVVGREDGNNANKMKGSEKPPPEAIEVLKKKTEPKAKSAVSNDKENLVKKPELKVVKEVKREKIVNLESRRPIRQEKLKPIEKKSVETKKPTTTARSSQDKKAEIYDPDEDCKNNPFLNTEYIPDILKYLRDIENEYPLSENFLDNSKITSKMRSTLVNWLADAHLNFKFELETLYLCVNLTDRYLAETKSVTRSTYQLVGTTALLLACKYEELYIPDISDFIYICDGAFSKHQILQMEIDITEKLDYKMGWPLPIFFLRRYCKIAKVDSNQYNLAKYILELALLEYSLAHIKPSIQAAAACCLSIAIMTNTMEVSKVWSPTLVHYTSYKYSDFRTVLQEYSHLLVNVNKSTFTIIKEKYSNSKFGKISKDCRLNGSLVKQISSHLVKKNVLV